MLKKETVECYLYINKSSVDWLKRIEIRFNIKIEAKIEKKAAENKILLVLLDAM